MKEMSRRQVLRWGGVGSFSVLAGCGSENGGGEDPNNTSTEPNNRAKIIAGDGDTHDQFGRNVGVDGTTVVIGAPNDEDPNGVQSGSAYVFVKEANAWEQRAKLVPEDGERGDSFGGFVTVSGDTALINADEGEENPSSIYVYRRTDSGWTQETKLVPDSGLGYFPAKFVGDGVIAGEPCRGTSTDGFSNGAVYELHRSNGEWIQRAEITPESVANSVECFGREVGGTGNIVAIYALTREVPMDGSAQTGVVYLFEKSGENWNQTARLIPDQRTDFFGREIAVSNNLVAVNSFEGDLGKEQGIVYVFNSDGTKLAKLSVEGFRKVPNIATNGERVFFGDWSNNIVYVFGQSNGGWTIQTELTPDDAESGDEFGASIAVDDTTTVIGAPLNDDLNGNRAGSAYVVTL